MQNGNHNGNGHHPNGASNGLVHLNGNGHKPNAPVITETEILWDGLAPATTRALSQDLDPSLVRQRRGRAGRVYNYLEGHSVIDQANRIFGYGGWGYNLQGDVTLRRMESTDPRTGEMKVSYGYSAPVRVTVVGAQPRTDIGFHAIVEDTPDGHDTAIKGAVTDGMKRALRSFGVQFGNSLYGDPVQVAGAVQPERVSAQAAKKPEKSKSAATEDPQAPMLRKRLMELGKAQGFNEKQVQDAVSARTGKNLDSLTSAELAPLVKAAANKLNQMQRDKASP